MPGKKYWFAMLPSKSDGSKTSIDHATSVGGWGLLSKAAEWYDHAGQTIKGGVNTVHSLLKSNTTLSDETITAWQRDALSITPSDINRSITAYPKSFYYTVRTMTSLAGTGKQDGIIGGAGNPLGTTGLTHPFESLGWDIYITKILVKTISASTAASTYDIGLSSNGTSLATTYTHASGKLPSNGTAGTINIITPTESNHLGTIDPWSVGSVLAMHPTDEGDCAGWTGELMIECFCPELFGYGLDQFGGEDGRIVKTFVRSI